MANEQPPPVEVPSALAVGVTKKCACAFLFGMAVGTGIISPYLL